MNQIKERKGRKLKHKELKEKNTCIGQNFNEKEISLAKIVVATLSSYQL
jgi:hypothetical protein